MNNMPQRGGVFISPNIVKERVFIDPGTGHIINNPKEKQVIDKNDGGVIPYSELVK